MIYGYDATRWFVVESRGTTVGSNGKYFVKYDQDYIGLNKGPWY